MISSKINLLFTIQADRSFQLISSSQNNALDPTVSERAGNALKKVIEAITGPTRQIKNPAVLVEGDCIKGELSSEQELALEIPGHKEIKVKLNQEFAAALSGTAKKKEAPPAKPKPAVLSINPLRNTSGTDCFINAVFQVVMQDTLLQNALLKTYQTQNSPQAHALSQAMKDYREGKPVSTNILRSFMPSKLQKGQQDASEFLQRLINGVSPKEYPELFCSITTTYDWEKRNWFGSVTETKTTFSSVDEFFIPLQVHSQSTTVSGEALIKQHFEKKKHLGEGYKDADVTFSPGQVQVQMDGSSKRLVFLLKRFTQSSKIHTRVDMPEMVEINHSFYALKKVVVHQGSTMGEGHYTSLLLTNDGRWTKASDLDISEVKDTAADRQNGYIYFYELVE